MSKLIELTDEQYQIIEHAAAQRGQTVQALLTVWTEQLRDRNSDPRYAETDEWLRHLGVSEAEIAASRQRVRDEAEMPYDADA